MSEVEPKQAAFEGWAIVEMMGHRTEIGFITTQAFGPAVLFRCDTPELPADREFILESPEYARVNGKGRQWCPAGTKVMRAGAPARSCLIAPSSLYAINPCSEAAAMKALERKIERPLIALELPPEPAPALSAGNPDDDDDERYGGTD